MCVKSTDDFSAPCTCKLGVPAFSSSAHPSSLPPYRPFLTASLVLTLLFRILL